MLTLKRDAPLRLKGSARMELGDAALGQADACALDRISVETALRNRCVPLASAGAVTPVACPDIQTYRRMAPHLRALLGPIVFRPKSVDEIERQILFMRGAHLAQRAETRAPLLESCRSWSPVKTAMIFLTGILLLITLSLTAPSIAFTVLVVWASLTLFLITGLRTLAAIVQFRHRFTHEKTWKSTRPNTLTSLELPYFSILVPLYDEPAILPSLVERLSELTYPKDKLEVCLVLEESDSATGVAMLSTPLPEWMRVVHVPSGHLQTKPRALNYAMDFAKGDIVGIYDAEDRPSPDQLFKVAETFHKEPLEVACLQGVLDFYNPRQSWLTRCFAIDYAMWFRLILPGIARLGLVVPLGGTTVFFRRGALEKMGRWDAHNVTEDADLGIRLARRGYRCKFLNSVTEEEATATIPTWLRQRSRWIKGYAMTWAVHMRQPKRLLHDLGIWRFLGLQIIFLCTLSQFVLAPLLWSFWLIIFGLPHPVTELAPWNVIVTVGVLFLASEVATMAVAALAVATPKHRWLILWVPMLHVYFPLAAIASWKAFWELMSRPFFWDKTSHGLQDATQDKEVPHSPLLPHPDAAALQTRG